MGFIDFNYSGKRPDISQHQLKALHQLLTKLNTACQYEPKCLNATIKGWQVNLPVNVAGIKK